MARNICREFGGNGGARYLGRDGNVPEMEDLVLSGLRIVKRGACLGLGPCDITSPLELCPDSERHVSGVGPLWGCTPLRHHRGASRSSVKAASSPVTSSDQDYHFAACITCLADCENALDGDFYAFIFQILQSVKSTQMVHCSPHIPKQRAVSGCPQARRASL